MNMLSFPFLIAISSLAVHIKKKMKGVLSKRPWNALLTRKTRAR